jgi:hypothetical protein
MTRFSVQAIDRRIGELRSVVDRSTASLVELEADVTRQLLETSPSLRGATAIAWAEASRRHADLWRGQFALEGLLTRIAEARGTRKSVPQVTLLRLDELFDAACIELPRGTADGRPRLTEGPTPTVSMTIDDALAQMSADYDEVAGLVASVAEVWGVHAEQLHELAADVSGLEAQVEEHAIRRPNELPVISRSIADLEMTARDDPLGLDTGAVSELHERVERVRKLVDEATRERQQRRDDLVAAERCIAAGLEAVEACRAQLRRNAEKIVVPDATWTALEGWAGELERLRLESERLRHVGCDGAVDGLRHRAESVLGGVRQLAGSDGAQLEKRDELRGILGAYLAKAQATGLGESRELDALYSAARAALYSAPCDLESAERLVNDFRHAVRPGGMASA